MATITVDNFLDQGTDRTAGEAWTINSGAVLTTRTDTRWHSNSPVSMTGSFGAMTINEGEYLIDARNVRWLAFDTGTGNVPAIGTSITQGAVSGYLLGVWSALNVAPTAVAAAMPATGFIKFREVTGGAYSAGALTGIGASATGADVTGWIEVVHDQLSNIAVGRLGTFRTRGDWFYLANTTGVRGQQIQLPTNGGGSASHNPGLWIETAEGSGVYDKYPGLYDTTNMWNVASLGIAEGESDKRQKFCKIVDGGILQLGESYQQASTYASLAAQASTYATLAYTMTYTWAGDVVTCYLSTGHGLEDGQQTGLDFTSGGATAYDGIYTVAVIDQYYFTVSIAGSGTAGNVTSRPAILVTFTAHTLAVGNQVYCDFTTGTGVDGTYEIYAVPSTSTYRIKYPHIAALTSGAVSVLHTLTITFTAHTLAIGNRVYLDFTSGGATDGTYTIRRVPTANTYEINYPHSVAITTSNVTARFDIGFVPPANCKVRIPNIITRQCTTAARATNALPHATGASRPEFVTTSAGNIDIEYLYDTGWYPNFSQPYSAKFTHYTNMDYFSVYECASLVQIDDMMLGHVSATATTAAYFSVDLVGVSITNSKIFRAPVGSYYAISFNTCNNITLDNVEAGTVGYARAYNAYYLNTCNNVAINNCRALNGAVSIVTCSDMEINDFDHVDRLTGWSNATTVSYLFTLSAMCNNLKIDGITFGYNGEIINNYPVNGMLSIATCSNITVRNAGTFENPLSTGTWEKNLYGMAYTHYNSGEVNSNIKLQRVYLTYARSGIMYLTNSDINMLFESIGMRSLYNSGMGFFLNPIAQLNCEVKGFSGLYSTTGQSSVYGQHFQDFFNSDNRGQYVLVMTEPTAQTSSQFTMVSGVARFNSSGGILMRVIGDQAIWEDVVFRKGHTGFINTAPIMSGGTATNYTLEYQIDGGSGWNGTWKTLTGVNLSAETISPTGFRLKFRITTTSTNTTAITFIKLDTTTTAAAQRDNLYPLDVLDANLTISGIVSGSDVVFYTAGTSTVLLTRDAISGTTALYNYDTIRNVDVGVFKAGYVPVYIRDYILTESDVTLPITQLLDRNYV